MDIQSGQLHKIFWHLPDPLKAQHLICNYYCLDTWMYTILHTQWEDSTDQCIRYNPTSQEDLQEDVYPIFYKHNSSPTVDDPLVSHKLSLIFMIFTIGSLMNTQAPAYNIGASKYYHLARAALFQSSLLESPTISVVQALFLMTFYLCLSNQHGSNSGNQWVIMGTAIKIAQNHDPSKWLSNSREILHHQTLFWELYTYDSWQAFGAKTPSYATVLQLDHKLWVFPVPPNLQVPGFGNSAPSAEIHHQDTIREMNLLYLHRSFFAQALTDHPKDLLSSSYGSSIITACCSTGSLITLVQNLHTQLKEPSEQIWFLWTHIFSCALESTCELFSKATKGFRAQLVLPSSSLEMHSLDGKGDELVKLSGTIRLVERMPPPLQPALLDCLLTSLNSVVPFPIAISGNNHEAGDTWTWCSKGKFLPTGRVPAQLDKYQLQ
ncbi:hypothetical protein V8B97DRAFT_1921272 [Scleroderma yunnanense]